ncbi:MAG TPA: hypothetical protein VGJ05_15135 [Fimbriiglobus sp.]|jgi:hypothetical protein
MRLSISVFLVSLAAGVGCESLRTPEPANEITQAEATAVVGTNRPAKFFRRFGPFAVSTDFEIDPADPLFHELETLPDQIRKELKIPTGTETIQVFLFDTKEGYERYMAARYPKLPTRRAYFVAEPKLGGSGDDLLVFTWMGEHLRTDLRHELTHAVLHGVLKNVPLWLDEGLAGYFELPPSSDGVNVSHLEVLRAGPFVPDLARLEKLGQVKQMEKPEYRESWAWVHFLLRSSPAAKATLLDYIQTLRTNPNPGPMLPKLAEAVGDPSKALTEHLATVLSPVTSGPNRTVR